MPLYTRSLLILLVTTLLFFSSFYLLLPTLPSYVQSLGGDQKATGLVVGVFTLSSVLFRPFVGIFADRHGRKVLLIAGAAVFAVSPFLYVVSRSVWALLLVRLFHGLGIAAFATSSMAMVADLFPSHRRGEGFGAIGMAAMVALSASPALGMSLQTNFSFRGVFLAEGVLAGAALGLCFFVKETFHHHMHIYAKGDMRGVFLPSLIIFLCTITYGSIGAFLPFFAHDISGFGLFYTSYALSSIGIRVPVGLLSDRVGREKILVPGLVTISLSLLLLSRSRSLTLLLLSGCLYGIGFSSVYPTLTALLVDNVNEGARARGLSAFTASFDLGVAGGSILFGLFPLSWIYPLGSLIVFSGLVVYLADHYLAVRTPD